MNRRNLLLKILAAGAVIVAAPVATSRQASADAERDHRVRLNALHEEMRKHHHDSVEFRRLQRAYQDEWNRGPAPRPPWERGVRVPSHGTFPGYVDRKTGQPVKVPWIEVNPIMPRGGAK